MNTKLEMEARFFTLTLPNCHFTSADSIKDPLIMLSINYYSYFLVIIMP